MKWALWIVLALAAVPLGLLLGSKIEDARHDRLFSDLDKLEAQNRIEHERFAKEAREKAEQEIAEMAKQFHGK